MTRLAEVRYAGRTSTTRPRVLHTRPGAATAARGIGTTTVARTTTVGGSSWSSPTGWRTAGLSLDLTSDAARSGDSRFKAVDNAMTRPFRRVVVVSNPRSSGDGPGNARRLAGELAARAPDLPVRLLQSAYPGHAVELARSAASTADGTLVISASGDGGYNEVVNGVMQATADGHPDTFAGVLASGNANDHASMARQPLLEAIVAGEVTYLDVLALDVDGHPVRYAHSYIGVGLSPVVAAELARHQVGAAGEIFKALKAVVHFHPVAIVHEGELVEVESLVFANINRMAKYLEISRTGSPDDGRFEVVLTADRGRLTLAADALRALTGHLSPESRSAPYGFTVQSATTVQLDGEIVDVPAGARISVSSRRRALASVQ